MNAFVSDMEKMSVSKLYTSARGGGPNEALQDTTEQLCSTIPKWEVCYNPSLPAEVQQQ